MRLFVPFALSFLTLILCVPGAAGAQETTAAELRVEWAEFKKAYDAKRLVVVDVRGQEAFEAGHIPGSISVPLDEVEKRVAELKKAGKPLVLYCS